MVSPSTSTSQLVSSSDGAKIYADCVGDAANPAIVFVHGFLFSGSVFDRIFSDPKYSESFYLVCFMCFIISWR